MALWRGRGSDVSQAFSNISDDIRNRRALRIWLVVIALMVSATAIVGAATRLTGSGLSITEWEPILGIIPPLTEADWQAAFAKYKAIPQYQQVNRGMSLAAFQTIYWWEWSHRLIARTIGIVFLVPFLWFLARGRIPRSLAPRLVLLFLLGGLQGAVGWYMVRSGLVDRVSVSQYRLAVHLGLAVLILGLLVWTFCDLRERRAAVLLATVSPGQRAMAAVVLSVTYVQILLGALVAGLKAGMTYNTWPLMDGALVPGGLLQLSPWYLNLFENPAMVQFNHRMAGYLLAVLAIAHAVSVIRAADDERVRATAGLLAALVLAQVGIGIWTLLAWVPLSLGIAHQAGALIVFAAAVVHFHAMGRAR
jgi:cytochrome c oxidase assembly protein subunit 15